MLLNMCDGVVTNDGTLKEFQQKIIALFSGDPLVRNEARHLAVLALAKESI